MRRSALLLCAVLVWVLPGLVFGCLPDAKAAGTTVVFPEMPYEGLQITFTVSGADLGAASEMANIPGATYGPGLAYRNGRMTGGPITVTGYATGAAGSYGYLEADVSGSNEPRLTFNAPETAWRKDFSFTVSNPDQFNWIALNIKVQRFSQYDAVVLYAEFANPNTSAATTAATTTPGPTSSPTTIPVPSDEEFPWKIAVGGAAAVAAAVTAIVAASTARTSRKAEKPDPDLPVGYVLQLSTNRLVLEPDRSTPLTATAFEVLPDGTVRPASTAQMTLIAPPGTVAQPQSGVGSVTAGIEQVGQVADGAKLTVQATAPRGQTSVAIAVEVATQYVMEFF